MCRVVREFDVAEDEFFDEKNFKEFNEKIKFRIFDPEHYETELHKEQEEE